MRNASIYRIGGIGAIASAVLYLVSIGLWMSADPNGAPPFLASIAYIISSLVFLPTLYALYAAHRDEAAGMSLVAVVLLAASTIISFFIDPTDLANPFVLILTLVYGAGGLLLGWLAYRSPRMPRGMGILVLAIGAISLVAAVFVSIGSADIAGLLNLIVGILFVVWTLWLGWHFLRVKQAVAQPA